MESKRYGGWTGHCEYFPANGHGERESKISICLWAFLLVVCPLKVEHVESSCRPFVLCSSTAPAEYFWARPLLVNGTDP